MDHQNKKGLCPRLLDYVIVAGSRNPSASHYIRRPLMLRRYPTEDHKDFALPFEIGYFCQPEGNFTFKPKISSDIRRTTSFTFCLTDKDTSKIRYGICLGFFRPARKSSPARSGRSGFATNYTLTSLCIISHHPFLATFRECLHVLHTIIDSCDYRASALSYRGVIWELLAGQIGPGDVHPSIGQEMREIELWILRLLCAPVPVPGKTRLEMDLLPMQNISGLNFGFPDRTRFPLVDYPLHLPFELLGVETGLKVLTCILLENKVLLRSKDVNAVSMTVMAYVAMLYPLEYMFPVIPLLPACMPNAEQLLLAPTPYIIGIPESFTALKNGFDIPDDVWLVDLDANKIYTPANGEELPPLPELEGATLRSHLEQALHVMSSNSDSGLNLDELSVQPLSHAPSPSGGNSTLPFAYGNDAAAVDIATRISIVRFLNSANVLGNLTEHVRTLRLYPRPVIAFQVYSFLRSRPNRSHFIDKFAKTQAVEYFAEYSLNPTNVAFLRVQTGISDPKIIGDKLKWFTEQLEPIAFQVYDVSCTFGDAIKKTLATEDHLHVSLFTDIRDGNDSDEDNHLHASFSSAGADYGRADFQDSEDVERLTYTTVTPNLESELSYCRPPESLQVPGNMMSQSSSFLSVNDMNDSNDESSRYSSPEDGPASIAERNPNALAVDDDNLPTSEEVTPKPPTSAELKRGSLINFRFGSIGSEASKPLKTSTTEQLAKLDKTMTDFADKSKQNLQKAAFLLKSLSNKEPSIENPLSLKISITGSDPNNNNNFVSDLATKLRQVGKDLENKQTPKPFGPFPSGRRNPLERKSLIRHDNAPSPPQSSHTLLNSDMKKSSAAFNSFSNSQNANNSSAQNTENQNFLKEICDGILVGESVGWLKLGRLKKLLEDESYRNYAVSRLNDNLGKQMNDTQYIEDIALTREQWKAYQKITQVCISGLEKTFQSWGLGGMGSAFQILEIAYTHYSDMKPLTSQQSGFSNLFQRPASSASPTPSDLNGRSIRQSESFGINSLNSDHLATGLRNVMNNVRTLTNNTTSILISAHDDTPPGPPSDTNSPPSSPDTEGPDSPSLSRRSSQSTEGPGTSNTDLPRLTPEIPHTSTDALGVQYLDPERSPFGSPNSSRRSSRSTDDGASTSGRSQRRLISHQSITSFNSGLNPTSAQEAELALESYSRKSSISSEYRYRHGQLLPSISTMGVGIVDDMNKVYLFEGLLGKHRSKVFDQMQFWDDAFIDAVVMERDLTGMDQAPSELMERYKGLGDVDRKRLEHDEDRLLTTMLYNLIAFMVALQVSKVDLRKTARRLLGKSHLGMIYSQEIHKLLDQLEVMNGNEIDLKPPVSRQTRKMSFIVYNGTDNTGDMCFMEVRDDGIVVRSINGVYMERIFYDFLINMTYSPKTKVLCLWHRPDPRDRERNSRRSSNSTVTSKMEGNGNGTASDATATKLNQFYCKKSKELYYSVKEAMERAASRGKAPLPGADLGGDFPIQDMKTGEGGLLQVTMDGVGLLFANSKYFMQLSHIRKCFTQKGGIFVLEEFNPDTLHIVQRKYKSPMADQICYSVLCLFSYIAAGSGATQNSSRPSF